MNLAKEWKIQQKLLAGFGLVVGLMVLVTAIGIQKVNLIDASLYEMTDVNSLKQRYAINFRGSVHDRAIALRDVVLMNDASTRQVVLEEIKQLEHFYEASAKPLDEIFAKGEKIEAKEREILEQIKVIERHTMPLIAQVISFKEQHDELAAQHLLLEEVRPAFKNWLNTINAFIDYEEAKNQHITSQTRGIASGFATLMIVLLVIAFFLASIVAFVISKNLIRALGAEPKEVSFIAARIARGDLSVTVQTDAKESILGAVLQMQENLRNMVVHIVHASDILAHKAQSVLKASHHSQNLAFEQEKTSTHLVKAIHTIRTKVDHIAFLAQYAEENTQQSADFSKQGRDMVTQTALQMDAVTRYVQDSASHIQTLHEHAQSIGGSANLIKEITDQTNLLALNAAIEAARAGEAGRGFAVVADEIRKLADRTDVATKEISQMINIIQSETQSAVLGMENVVSQVEGSFKIANEAVVVLEQIYTQATDSLAKNNEMNLSSTREAQNISGLAGNVEEIASMSKSTNQSMEENVDAVQELITISQELQTRMRTFTL